MHVMVRYQDEHMTRVRAASFLFALHCQVKSTFFLRTHNLQTMAAVADVNICSLPKRNFIGVRGDVTVLHWNVLAQSLCFDDDKPAFAGIKNAETVLSWEYRKPLILAVMLEHAPDFICAVEVDKFEELLAELRTHGYDGIFAKKCADDHDDGCAIFYKPCDWALGKTYSKKLVRGHSQIALYGYFRSLARKGGNERGLTIVSTHLKAKPGFEALREQQLLNVVRGTYSDSLCPSSADGIPDNAHKPFENIIVTGDFNDVPTSAALKHHANVDGLGFEDTYHNGIIGRDQFTTYKQRTTIVKRVIDYIIFKSDVMLRVGKLEQPEATDLPDMLPASYYPSDHIALLASFRFTD
jgi:mRNA deadenylase 3'-5' endonuclease subunit Ccr4